MRSGAAGDVLGRLPEKKMQDRKILQIGRGVDLGGEGVLVAREWRFCGPRRSAQNGLIAIRLGGEGDMTDKSVIWRYEKALPNVPSPLLYENVLYMLKEGGIFTSLEPATGKVIKQARLVGALDQYFSSPVG